jgi:AcrR family transcriptional regulator
VTRRAADATTAGPPGPRSSASTPRPPNRSPAPPADAATKPKPKPKPKGKAKGTAPSTATVDAPRRARAKRGQGDQLREQILDAAYDLLVETGSADKVSTRAVAQRVGCSSPALYLHFPDKAALLWATCNRQFLRLGDRITAAVDGVDDPLEALHAAARAYVTFGAEHAEEYRVMMMVPDMVIWNPPISELPAEAGFDVLHGLIERAMAAGVMRVDDPVMVALTVWAAVHGIVALRVAKPTFEWPPIDAQIDLMLRVMTNGLGPDPAATPRTRAARRRPNAR